MSRRMPPVVCALGLLCLALAPAPARAQSVHTEAEAEADRAWSPSIGARIGGYGFRQLNEQGDALAWQACRMNGVGVYGDLELPWNAYAQLSGDFYHAIAKSMNEGLDRLSFLAEASLGWRLMPEALITPNIHFGGGAEWTWVSVFGREQTRWTPVGFMGLGGEINLERLHFGGTIRANAMRLPDYDWRAGGGDTERALDWRTEVAGQVLFSVRYDI